jgi:hypothetical protein
VWVDRSAVRLREDEPVIFPDVAGAQPFCGLLRAVGAPCVDELRRQTDRPVPGAALRLDEHEPTADLPLQCPSHSERAAFEVEVVPRQTERFTLAQPERECH